MHRRILGAAVVVAALLVAAGLGVRGASAAGPVTASAGGPYYGAAGQFIQFSGAGSTGLPRTFIWTFSDGTTAAGQTVAKAFATPGAYTATLMVADISGQRAFATAQVNVGTVVVGVAAYPSGIVYGSTYYPSGSYACGTGYVYGPGGYPVLANGAYVYPYGWTGVRPVNTVVATDGGYATCVFTGGQVCSTAPATNMVVCYNTAR
jgi:hypothetical protein